MTSAPLQTMASHMRVRRQALLDDWVAALLHICKLDKGHETLRADLDSLLHQIIALLDNSAHDTDEARQVGRRLATVTCTRPEILGATHLVFSRHSPSEEDPTIPRGSTARLASFLGQMALGFSSAADSASPMLRQLVEEGRRAERRFYTTILDMVDALVCVADADGHIVGFNGACERVSGFTFDEVYGRQVTFVLAPEYYEKSQALLASFKKGPPAAPQFTPHYSEWLSRDGARHQIEWSTTAIFDDDGDLTYIIGTGVDVTARRRMEKELARAHRQVAQVREAERLRLAQDLHDDAVQQLLGLSYQLAELHRRASEPGRWTPAQQLEELIPGLEMVRGDLIGVVQELRRLISSLRPPALQELGLAQVLDAYVENWCRRVGRGALQVDLQFTPDESRRLPESVAICIFRVVQESLWNVQKHAAATHVEIQIAETGDAVTVRVRDNGDGFRIPSHLLQFAASGRFGLIGMQERVHALEGLLSVWSEPGMGAEIQAHIPLGSTVGQPPGNSIARTGSPPAR